MSKLDELYRLHRLLDGRRTGLPRAALITEHGFSRSTLARLIADLRDKLNAPLIHDPERGGYRYDTADGRHPLPGLWFSADELLALVTLKHLLAHLEPGLLDERSRRIAEATLQAATAAVTLAEANLAQAEAQRQYADVQLQRTTELAEKGLVSTQREQQVQLEAATARDGVTASEAALAMRRQELASARAALIEGEAESAGPCCTEVRSPTTGNVLAVLTESAQVVSAGMPLLDIGDPTDLEVVVDVLSSDAVTIPERAEARIDRWGGEPLRAAVKRIDPVAVTRVSALGIEEQRTRVVLDLLDGPQVRPRLGHGFRVVAMIAVWRGNVLAVPLGALFRQGDDWVVFVVEDGRAQLRTIEIGRRNNEIAEVVAGLEMGDQVIVHPADTLESGSAVVTPASGS